MRRVLASWRVPARRNPTFHKVSTSDSGVQSSSVGCGAFEQCLEATFEPLV